MDMVKLKECVFNDCDITGDGLTRLTALPGSKKLVLPDIDINDDPINGLATLDKFDLVLKNTNCSMAQLRKLGQIKGMTSINLLGSQSVHLSRKEMAKLFPFCQVSLTDEGHASS